MGFLIAFAVVIVLVFASLNWISRKRKSKSEPGTLRFDLSARPVQMPEMPKFAPTPAPPASESVEVKAIRWEYKLADMLDLRALDAVDGRIRGQFGYLEEDERKQYQTKTYILRRDPENPHDPNAIAVYTKHRQIGYVSAGRAEKLAPLLDQIGAEGYLVNSGAKTDTVVTKILLPKIPALRKLANESKD